MSRKQIDWEIIERDYRAGQLSIREIARQHEITDTAIRKKAKDKGWQRSLAKKVAAKVRTDLVRTVRSGEPLTEDEIIQHAAAKGVEVVRGHQKRIGDAQKIVDTLLTDLSTAIEKREEIEDSIIDETAEDVNTQRRAAMMKAVSLPSHAGTLKSLSDSMKTFVALERQAFNLDDDQSGGSTIEDFLNEVTKRNKGLVAIDED